MYGIIIVIITIAHAQHVKKVNIVVYARCNNKNEWTYSVYKYKVNMPTTLDIDGYMKIMVKVEYDGSVPEDWVVPKDWDTYTSYSDMNSARLYQYRNSAYRAIMWQEKYNAIRAAVLREDRADAEIIRMNNTIKRRINMSKKNVKSPRALRVAALMSNTIIPAAPIVDENIGKSPRAIRAAKRALL